VSDPALGEIICLMGCCVGLEVLGFMMEWLYALAEVSVVCRMSGYFDRECSCLHLQWIDVQAKASTVYWMLDCSDFECFFVCNSQKNWPRR